MAFYYSSDTNAFYDTDVFPVASLPANKVEVAEADYQDLLSKQNSGYVILSDVSGNPYAVAQGESPATDIIHAASVATTVALGHVKIGNTMQAANDGTLDLKDGAVTTEKIADLNVTTEKIDDGAVTEEKLESVKDLAADEDTLTMSEDANGFTLSVKDGGIGATQIANQAIRQQHLNAYAVTTNALNNEAVTTDKIADSAIQSRKIQNGAVTREKLDSTIIAVLPFKDSSNNDLNGTDWGDTWIDSSTVKMIGNIGSYAVGRLIDFTLSFGFHIPQSQIPVGFSFSIFIGNNNAHVAIETRTVNVTDDSYFVHERFTFKTTTTAEIQVNIYPGGTQGGTTNNRVELKNIQLRGFVM